MPLFSPGDIVAYRPTQRGAFSEDEFYRRYNPDRVPFVFVRQRSPNQCFIRLQGSSCQFETDVLGVSSANLVHSGPPETVRAISNRVYQEYIKCM